MDTYVRLNYVSDGQIAAVASARFIKQRRTHGTAAPWIRTPTEESQFPMVKEDDRGETCTQSLDTLRRSAEKRRVDRIDQAPPRPVIKHRRGT